MTYMPENVLNDTTNAALIPTIIANKVLQRLPSLFSVAKNVTKDNELTTATVGKTIQIAKTGSVQANDKVAGVAFTKQNPTATSTSVTLDKHKEVTFTIDDVTKVLEQESSQDKYGEDGAIALAEAVESDLLALHPSLQRTKTWDRTSAATIDTSLLAIRQDFVDQKVPVLEQKFLTIPTLVMTDLLKQQKYTDISWRGQNGGVTEGQILKIYGMQIEESQLIPVTGSPVAYHGIAFTRGGLVLASRPLPKPQGFGGNYSVINDANIGIALRTLFWYNGDLGAHQLTIDLLYGVAILDQRRVMEIESF